MPNNNLDCVVPQLNSVLFRIVVEEDTTSDGVDLHFCHVNGREEILEQLNEN